MSDKKISKNRMTKNKKGMVFNIMIVIFTVLILTYAFIRLSEKTNKIEREIGVAQIDMIMQIQEGEKALMFIDLAAKMALYQAVFDLQSKGGILESKACGSYYGFNRWNSDSGQKCFVSSSSVGNSLRDIFVSSLSARIASYPSADFMTNVPGFAALLAERRSVTIDKKDIMSCGDDFTKDFTYGSSQFFPENGARLWIPSEARCPGAYPLIVFLHDCMRRDIATVHKDFGDSGTYDIIPYVKQFVSTGKSKPVILGAPSQTGGTATIENVPGSPCGESLWGREFDPSQFVELVEQNLPVGVKISSVSFVGHGGAGCDIDAGTHKAAKMDVFAIGQFDSCANKLTGESLKSKIGSGKKFFGLYGVISGERSAQNNAMGITKTINCASSGIKGIGFIDCLSDKDSNYFVFSLKDADEESHGQSLDVGMEQFLLSFFAAEENEKYE